MWYRFHFWIWLHRVQRGQPARIRFHVHTGAEEASPYCLNRSEIFPSLWFSGGALRPASDFIPQHFAGGQVWELRAIPPMLLKCVSRGDRSGGPLTSWWCSASRQAAAVPPVSCPWCKLPPEGERVCRKAGGYTGGRRRELQERC